MIVEISNNAEADLLNIGDYIAQDNPTRALGLVTKLRHRILTLANTPFAYPEYRRGSNIRKMVIGRHLVFYAVERDLISVVRILGSEMDVDKIIFPEG